MDPRSYNNLIIPGWMVFELKLNYSELRVYALIYGFSQGGQGEFYGSLQYLADWCGISSRKNVTRVLRSLCAKKLLVKRKDKALTNNGRVQTVVHYQARIPECLMSSF